MERKSSIGMIYADNQPVQPGATLHRKLRAVGDVSVTGVINIMNQRSLAMVQGTKKVNQPIQLNPITKSFLCPDDNGIGALKTAYCKKFILNH